MTFLRKLNLNSSIFNQNQAFHNDCLVTDNLMKPARTKYRLAS